MVMPRSAALAQLQVWSGDPPWRGAPNDLRISCKRPVKTYAPYRLKER
jgi:hypothetical protein